MAIAMARRLARNQKARVSLTAIDSLMRLLGWNLQRLARAQLVMLAIKLHG